MKPPLKLQMCQLVIVPCLTGVVCLTVQQRLLSCTVEVITPPVVPAILSLSVKHNTQTRGLMFESKVKDAPLK